MNLQESIRRIVKEELHSPAGDKYKPNKYVVHKSAPHWRENIELTGLQTSVGDCYQIYVGGDVKCKKAIFATDSLNDKDMFDSTYDDDIWIIDTECAGVSWFKDTHYFKQGDYNYHIVTFKNISPDLNNLLIKILQTNLNDRISIKEALKDKYFNEYSKQSLPEFQGGYYDKTNVLNLYKYNYSIEDWTKKQSELSYLEEIHINYKDNVLPKFDEDIGFYKNINDLLKSFKTDEELNILMTSGIDILANSIIYYRSNNINDKDIDLLKLICVFYSRVFTIDNKFLNGVLESNNYLSK